MPKEFTSLGRAATREMLVSDAPTAFTSHWQASAIDAGRRAGLTDAEILEMTGFAVASPEDGGSNHEEGGAR